MKIRTKNLSILLMVALFISACNLPTATPTATPTVEPSATTPATGSLSGTVWHDLCALPDGPLPNPLPTGCMLTGFGGATANGTREPGEPGIPGVQVTLHKDTCAAPVFTTAFTDANGAYAFTGLADGVYCITVDSNIPPNDGILLPGAWTKPTSLTSVAQLGDVLKGGVSIPGYDFGWDYQFLPEFSGPPPTQPAVASATPAGNYFIVDVGANCRRGPGTVYEVVTTFPAGTYLSLVGRNTDNSWWYIQTGSNNCWISGSTGRITGSTANLQVVAAPPTPTPSVNAGPLLSDPVALVAEVSYPSNCTSNTLIVAIKVTDNGKGINSVWLSYRYLGDGGIVGAWKTVLPNDNAAGGVYGFNYPIGAEAALELGTQNGTLQYQFFARDNSSNTSSYPNGSVLGLPIKYCP